MNKTERSIAKGMAERAKRMHMRPYTFTVRLCDLPEGGASVTRRQPYLHAFVDVDRRWFKKAQRCERDEVFFHELAHLLFEDIAASFPDADHEETAADHIAAVLSRW